MAKTDPDILANAINEELISYLQSGQINPLPLHSVETLEQYDLENFSQLKSIHFMLQEPVIDYLDRLPDRLRRLKTTTRAERNVARGEIDGKIDWQDTYRERAKRGYNDRSLFAIESPSPVADIAENRVLKAFLGQLKPPLKLLDTFEYEWSEANEETVIAHVSNAITRHILLSDLPADPDMAVSTRDLKKARQSRHDLYSEAARFYQLYEDLMENRFQRPAVREVMANTIITPSEGHRLFELFCMFRIIKALSQYYQSVRLHTVQTGSGPVAQFSISHNDCEEYLRVFWDQTGPYKFSEPFPDQNVERLPGQLRRFIAARKTATTTETAFLGREPQMKFYSGRPDLLIERNRVGDETTNLQEIIIGEFKYSQRTQQFRTGVQELTEYLHFVRREAEYLYTSNDVIVSGILCTEFSDVERNMVNNIIHLTTSDLQSASLNTHSEVSLSKATIQLLLDAIL